MSLPHKLLVGCAGLMAVAFINSASAADMPVKAVPKAVPAAVSWTGCYVSGGLGYGMWNEQRYGETLPGSVQLAGTIANGGQGWLGRVGAGCDYQVAPSFVIGVFGDYDFMNLKSENFTDVFGAGVVEKESGSFAAGLRIGYLPEPNLLTFISGGWTQARFGRQELFNTFTFPATPVGAFIDAHTYNGAFIGGGYEYRLPWVPGLALKTEYRFNWYGATDLPIVLDGGVPTGLGEHVRPTVQTITTGLVWRFNMGSAGVAPLPVKASPPPPASWTGCYVSGGAGYGMWNQEHYGETLPGSVPLTGTGTSGGQGWLGRLGGGCDYQVMTRFLIGAFGDYDVMNLTSKNYADVSGLGGVEKESSSWAAGVRLGYLPNPNFMTFVSGGWTRARFDRQELFVTLTFPAIAAGAFVDAHTYNGAFIGGGYEYRLPWMQNLAWKTEYRMNWYRADDLPIFSTGGVPTGLGENNKKTVQTITTSLVWRFNWGASIPSLN